VLPSAADVNLHLAVDNSVTSMNCLLFPVSVSNKSCRGDVMECSMDMMVAVVDPLLQNENWSVKERVGGGWRSATCKK